MAEAEEQKQRDAAKQSLERLQEFDVESLPREKDLGTDLNFRDAVEPARKLISLYRQITTTALVDFPPQQLNQLKKQADADFNRLEEILNFTTAQANPHDVRKNLVAQLEAAYQPSFNQLHPLIAYSISRSADIQRLETEARAMIQDVMDQSETLTGDLANKQKEAEGVLDEIRKVAGEQGVSQQAIYFKDESTDHETKAEQWRKTTFKMAGLLGLYAIFSIFIHKIPWIAPENTYQTIQLGVSKVLIFAVISYILYLAARNYLAHKHNAIVNKHRQNALMTYRALVDASKDLDNKEVILTHASACIFGPQSTGYSREGGSSAPTAKSVVELLNKPFTPDE